jgi:broad specificity phosphatase PhoE
MAPGQLHLLFIRHGETQDNIDRILQGWRDTSLTPKGLSEARILADKMQSQQIDAIYHSPLIRITQTIAPILESRRNFPKSNITPDLNLRGQGLGDMEGGSYDTVDMSNPRSADPNPGVEKFDDFVQRLKDVMGRIISEQVPLMKDGEDRYVVVATHGVAITSIFKTLESTTNCAGFNPVIAVRGPDAWEVRWTDSDDVAELVVPKPGELPLKDRVLEWDRIEGKPFVIERWGKKEKAL